MKHLKIIYLSIILVLFTLSSCVNEESIVKDQENASQSISAKNSMNELKSHFDRDGNQESDNNQTGNILFDFCFDFEYPVTLSYNTGSTVVINDFDALISVLINTTDNLYVDGIVFPFNAVVFDENAGNNGQVVIITITNETEFKNLVTSCGFDDDDCQITTDYTPVCVQIQDPTGDNFIVEFPNMSAAFCEGFTQNDIVDCGNVVTDPGNDDACYTLVYPVNVVLYDGTVVAINSDEELEDLMYNIVGNFDFEYPFNITLTDGTVQTMSTPNDYYMLLEDCNGDVDPCTFCTLDYAPVCVYVQNEIVEYTNFCMAECAGYTQADIVDCSTSSDDCWMFVFPIQINNGGDDMMISTIEEFNANYNASSSTLVYPFNVIEDGVESVIESPNNFWELGEFEDMCE